MAINLSNNASDGTVLGNNVTDKIGFYGATAIVRATVSSGVATNSATTITSLQAVISALGNLGLITAT